MARSTDPLALYRKKRKFDETPEPAPEGKTKRKTRGGGAARFMVHKHDATRLHYDLRLEGHGALVSWAIPKGPSYDPAQKRLAVRTEDHPLAYGDFEGRIPDGHYGAGDSIVWEDGTYDTEPPGQFEAQLKKGHLEVVLDGQKLKGKWHLIRTRPLKGKEQWLIFKAKDETARPDYDVETERPESVKTGTRETHGPTRKGARSAAPPAERAAAAPPEPASAKAAPAASGGLMLATLSTADEVDADRYRFEVKYDGFRVLAGLQSGRVVLMSRGQQDYNSRFPEVVAALQTLKVKQAVLDGEVVSFDAKGVSRFERLQQGEPAQYAVFDLLQLNDEDLRALPLEERRARLEKLLKGAGPPLLLAQEVKGSTSAALKTAETKGWEGIIAKRKGSRYVSDRSRDWLKLKVLANQELAIAGFTEHSKGRAEVGALLLAVSSKEGFRYAGKVGTGFSQAMRESLLKELQSPKLRGEPPLGAPRMSDAHWVRPTRVAQIRFTEWTRDGRLRHPSFQGLRDDKKPEETFHEVPVDPVAEGGKASTPASRPRSEGAAPVPAKKNAAASVTVTHGDRVLFPRDGFTKDDVFAYYRDVAQVMVPALADRPLAYQQWPQGIAHAGVFRQGVTGQPGWATTAKIEHMEKAADHLVVDRPETLLWLANQSALTLHIPQSRLGQLESPDWVLFDLDPAGDDRAPLIQVARVLQKLLEKRGLDSVPKTSGQRGLHVLVPLAKGTSFAQVQTFSQEVMAQVEAQCGDIATTERAKVRRGGRLYLDAMQNAQGKTMVAPYSLRARDGAPVSTPLEWREVTSKLDPGAFNLRSLRKRLDAKGDLFAPVLAKKQPATQRL